MTGSIGGENKSLPQCRSSRVLGKNPGHAAPRIRGHTVPLRDRRRGRRVTLNLPNTRFRAGLARASAGSQRLATAQGSHVLCSPNRRRAPCSLLFGEPREHSKIEPRQAFCLSLFFGMCAVDAMLGSGGSRIFALEASCATSARKYGYAAKKPTLWQNPSAASASLSCGTA